MRKFAVLAAASVAAFSASAALAQEVSPFAGPYVGIQLSYGQLATKHTDLDWHNGGAEEAEIKGDGALGGLKLGYNYVRGNLLAAVEIEGQMGKLDSFGIDNRNWEAYEIGSKSKLLGSARAKLGLTTGNLAFALNGGVAFNNGTQRYVEGNGYHAFAEKSDRVGYVVGLGGAYAVSEKVFVGLDLSRYQFGNKTHTMVDVEEGYTDHDQYRVRDRYDVVSISVNYKF